MSEDKGLFRKPGQSGAYGSPEFLVKQAEAIDVLTGNGPWSETTRRNCLRIARGEITADELIDDLKRKRGLTL